MSQLKVV